MSYVFEKLSLKTGLIRDLPDSADFRWRPLRQLGCLSEPGFCWLTIQNHNNEIKLVAIASEVHAQTGPSCWRCSCFYPIVLLWRVPKKIIRVFPKVLVLNRFRVAGIVFCIHCCSKNIMPLHRNSRQSCDVQSRAPVSIVMHAMCHSKVCFFKT